MTTKELKNKIEKVLGNSIRCLLPSYWWKRLFGLIVDKVGEIEKSVGNKQEKLVSGENIKTINGEDILGNGNIEIEGGSNVTVDAELDKTSVNPIANKAVANALEDKASKTYVTDEIGKIKIPDAVKVDTELSEESSNAIANSAVTAALNRKQDKAFYEVDLGTCEWLGDLMDRWKNAIENLGVPSLGIIKVKGKLFSGYANYYFDLDGFCDAEDLRPSGEWKGYFPNVTDINGNIYDIGYYIDADRILITQRKGGVLYINDDYLNSDMYLSNTMLYHDMGWADDFKVNYNGILLNPLSIHHEGGSSGTYFTIEINGTVETWRLFIGYSEIDDSIRTRTTKISSVPVGGSGEIDTSDFATKDELLSLTNEMVANEKVHAAAYSDLNSRLAALEAALSSINQ